jgi:hypothetical protein|tara:strand:- start:336 stop:1337 length:1002 start_codon:yes stop_codon:yes gene_type:complete
MIYTNYFLKFFSTSKKLKFITILLVMNFSFISISFPQSNFEFLNINENAKIKALGGNNVSLHTNQNYYLTNPSLLFFSKNKNILINHMKYVLDISSSSILYTDSINHLGKYGLGIKYFSYGKFEGYDVFGNYTGLYNPKEFSINFTKAIKFSNFIFGTNIKYVFSKIYDKANNAILIDLGGIFYPTNRKDITIGINISNFGFLLSKENISLPLYVQLGTTFKPKYMPVRVSFTLNKSSEKLSLNDLYSNSFAQFLSHMNIGLEILISKNLNFQLGYNYKINQELSLTNNRNNGGLSYGIEIVLRRFNLNYGRVIMNTLNTSNIISLNFNLKKI